MTIRKPQKISRRKFLQASAVGAAGAALAACAPAESTATTAASTSAPNINTGAKQTVRYLSWWFEEGNRGKTWHAFIKEFNESQDQIEVVAEQIPFDQYTTKT